jgi:hypothetical protein
LTTQGDSSKSKGDHNFPTDTNNPSNLSSTIDKPIMNAPTPRVQAKQSTTTNATPTPKITNPVRNEMRDKLINHLRSKTIARIPQRNMYLH